MRDKPNLKIAKYNEMNKDNFGILLKRYALSELYLLFVSATILIWCLLQFLGLFSTGIIQYNVALFIIISAITYFSPKKGLIISLFLLPFLSGLIYQINSWSNRTIPVLFVWSLDISCGLILGFIARFIKEKKISGITLDDSIPAPWLWSVAAIQVYFAASAFLSISRNLNQTSTLWTLKGFLYNLILTRNMIWQDDFFPLQDLMTFSALLVLLLFLVRFFRQEKWSNPFAFFAPLMYANVLIVLYAILQKYYTIGFYYMISRGFNSFFPDIHSFAGYELICAAIGLSGLVCKRNPGFLYTSGFLIACCGIILSGSRFSMVAFPILCFILLGLLAKDLSKRRVIRIIIGILLLTSITGALFYKSSSGQYLMQSLSWEKLVSKDFNTINSALSLRPEIWKSTLLMYSKYPLMGLGLAACSRSSSIEGFSTSSLMLNTHGANAHNYFIQLLSELGAAGIIILILPFLFIKNFGADRRIIFGILISFAFGNLYDNELIQREFLVILVVILGFLFATGETSARLNNLWNAGLKSGGVWFKVGVAIILAAFMFALAYEAYGSFHKEPFKYAQLCGQFKFDQKSDHWVTSDYEHIIHVKHAAVTFKVRVDQPRIESRPVLIRFGQRIKGEKYEVGNLEISDRLIHELRIPNLQPFAGEVSYFFETNRCFVPKSWGVGYDSRRLGIIIDEIKIDTR
jgi:hypothetical protein